MMSKNDERKIIDSLANDKTVEMKFDDLEQLLNAELSKPETEMDTQLIKEILDVMEPAEPDPEKMRLGWAVVKENLPERRGRGGWHARFARIAAAVAVISIVLVSTVEDAGAFRWTLLQKLLKPVAETFGIIIDDQPDDTLISTETSVYAVENAPSDLQGYTTLDDVPQMYGQYMIRPKWIPEGFVFSAGSHYSGPDSEIFSLDFVNDHAFFNLHIHINTLDSTVYFREFERNLDVPIEMTIGQHQVTFYNNTEDKEQSAFWIYENAHYLLVGELSFEEVKEFIENVK